MHRIHTLTYGADVHNDELKEKLMCKNRYKNWFDHNPRVAKNIVRSTYILCYLIIGILLTVSVRDFQKVEKYWKVHKTLPIIDGKVVAK